VKRSEDLTVLKIKSVCGFGYVLQRQVIVKFIFVLGNVALARILEPRVFGAYAIIAFVLQFFSSFADVGLGAALIQSKHEPNEKELSTTFWIQQGMAVAVFCAVSLFAPLITQFYPSIPPETVGVMRCMAAGFFFASLKTLPLITMERAMEFRRIAQIEIVEQVVFYVTAVSCALAGFQIWSFVLATIMRELIGAVMAFASTTWRPLFSFTPNSIRELVFFGIPFQTNNILNFIKEGVTPIFVGVFSGAAGVGYITWARTFAFTPLVISESFGRVAFPAFSAIQEDRELLRKAVELSMRMMTLVLFPVTILIGAFAPEIIRVFFTEKWMPGLAAFYLYCTTPLMIGMMLPMYSAILSLGKSGLLLKMTVLLVILEWGLGIPFVMQFGYTGIALNQPIITGIYFFVYRRILQAEGVSPEFGKNVWRQLTAALLVTVTVRGIAFFLPVTAVTLPLFGLGGLLLFIGVMYIVAKSLVMELSEHVAVVVAGD
jgi:O-antigen/teichoic acid export membrane protein